MASITGTSGNDTIAGTTAAESIFGGDGNDTITGLAGNDSIYGGKGTDTAKFSGAYSDYKITALYETQNFLTGVLTGYQVTGTDGTDMIASDVEYLYFNGEASNYVLSGGVATLVDVVPPTVAVSSNSTSLSSGTTATLTFTLSEASTNFIASDITVTGGAVSSFTGSGTIYTAIFTPTANSTTQGVVSIASGMFTDAANNANADGSDTNNTVSFAVDTRIRTYYILAASNTVDEGSTATFTLTTTNVTSGTSVAYTLSGISSADITGGLLTGSATVNSSGTATILVPIAADVTTEGAETLILTVQSKTASVTINDTSPSVFSGTGTSPVKVWTKLLGSGSFETASALTTGLDGSIYVSGYTTSVLLDGQPNSGDTDAFLTKYSADGSKVWTKLLGTSGGDLAYALATGLDGSIYVGGFTSDALDGQANSGSYDAFLTKYTTDGTKAWTKLLGTSVNEYATSLTTGLDGSIYVGGYTTGALNGQTNSGG